MTCITSFQFITTHFTDERKKLSYLFKAAPAGFETLCVSYARDALNERGAWEWASPCRVGCAGKRLV